MRSDLKMLASCCYSCDLRQENLSRIGLSRQIAFSPRRHHFPIPSRRIRKTPNFDALILMYSSLRSAQKRLAEPIHIVPFSLFLWGIRGRILLFSSFCSSNKGERVLVLSAFCFLCFSLDSSRYIRWSFRTPPLQVFPSKHAPLINPFDFGSNITLIFGIQA